MGEKKEEILPGGDPRWRAQEWDGNRGGIDIAESHGNSEALKDRFYHLRWLYRYKGGSLGVALLELDDGGRKEWWKF